MSAETLSLTSSTVSPFGDLQRLYRRVCVLRATGKTLEAEQLEQAELAPALEALRGHGDDERIEALLATEENRVADAQVLAELLAPMLTRSLSGALKFSVEDASRTSAKARSMPPAPDKSGAAPSIADFIEGMLAQDRS